MGKNNRVSGSEKNPIAIGLHYRLVSLDLPVPRVPSDSGGEQIVGRCGANRRDKERIKAMAHKSAKMKCESRDPPPAFFEPHLAMYVLVRTFQKACELISRSWADT